MSRSGLSIIYAVIPPLIFMLILVIAMLGTARILERYDIRVVRKAVFEKQVKFGRTPVVQLGQDKYAVLGVKFHSDPRRRAVIVRNIRTNQVMSAYTGQQVFGAAKVMQITTSQITFAKDSQTVIVGVPSNPKPRRKRWI